MSLPTRDKTWEIVPNLRTHIDTSSAEETNKGLILLIKDTITDGTAFTNPWIVESSCDSVAFGNNDQVDRWLDTGDIVHGVGNHSWVVLKDAISGQEFCFDANDATSAMRDADVVWSPSVGFGLAAGGTDGTLAARPTATDEVNLVLGTQWGPGGTAFVASTLHVWRSADGEVTRIGMMRARVCDSLWDFSVPKDPIAAWSPKAVASFARQVNGKMTYAQLNDTSNNYAFFHSGTIGVFHIGTVGLLSSAVLEQEGGRVPHAANGGLGMVPACLVCLTTATLQGVWGTMFDFYWAPDTVRTGEVISDGTDYWVCVDDIWFPWIADTAFLVA